MKRIWAFLALAMLLTGLIPAALAQGPTPQGETPELTAASPTQQQLGAAPAAPAAANPEDVLWDQYANYSGANFAAQDFEAAYDVYDIFAADDFENLDTWTIETIVTRGGWTGFVDLNNATAISWWICPDNGGEPLCDPPGDGNAVWSLSLPPTDPQVALGVSEPEDVVLTLDTPVVLPAGTWWLVYQASLEFGVYGQYGWSGTADAVWGTQGLQNNPGGGFGMGAGWWPNTSAQDQMFRLEGTIGGADCTWVELVVEDFETWPPTGWDIVDYGGSCVWESNATTGRTNYAGGDGLCADADSDWCGSGTTMDTGLQSPHLNLSTALSATLQYVASYNDISAGGTDYADVNFNESGTWTNLLSWDEDHDAYGPGEVVTLDLPVGDPDAFVEFQYIATSWDWWFEVDQIVISACVTSVPEEVRLTPAMVEVEGCAGVPQEHIFNLENLTGVDDTFTLTYAVHTGNGTLTGPDNIYLGNGANQDFIVTLTPNECLPVGTEVGASIFVIDSSGMYSDTSWITKTTFVGGWESVPGSAPSWAGAGYPVDGCAAMNGDGEWVTYIIGDQSTIVGFWGYNHDTNTWFQPAGTAPPDRWAPDWAYDDATNLCYLTGGATAPGGGDIAEAWEYDPVADTWTQLPNFTNQRDFHDSWVGTLNGTKFLCIGGGTNAGSVIQQSTQCYDIVGGAWNAENADMDPYPTDPFGAADGTLHAPGGDQFWYVGGAKDNFATVTDEVYAWDDADDSWHLLGNTGVPRYRVEGDFKHGAFYQLAGSSGGFTPTPDAVRGEYVGGVWVWTPMEDLPNARMDNVAVMIPPYTLAGWKPVEPATVYVPEAVVDLVGEGVEAAAPMLDAPVYQAPAPDAVLWDNGPLVTHPGACSSPGADASRLQTGLGMNTLGFGNQFANGYRMADDFVVDGDGWTVDQITFYAYQTSAPGGSSTITGLYLQIWDGSPDDPGSSVIWGDLVTNVLASTAPFDTQRDSETSPCANNRYVFASIAAVGIDLPPGTYWLDWLTDGSTSYSGPWAPPITIIGDTTTGNALQYTTAWAPALDSGTSTQQGMPFIIEGSAGGGAAGTIWSVDGYGDANADYVDFLHQCPPCEAQGWLEGYVYDLDNDMAVPCTDAVVHIEPGNLDIPVDPAGYYTVTLSEGEYYVAASAPGYSVDGPYTVTVVAETAVQQDFGLYRPYIMVTPMAFSVTLPAGQMMTYTMVISNLGGLPLDYEIFEQGGAMEQLAIDPKWFGVDSWIENELATSADGKADVFIALDGSIDLSPATAMNWDSRGAWVYSALQARAETTQSRVTAWLDARGIEYRSFLIDNTVFARLSQSEIDELAQFPEVVGFRGNHVYYVDPIVDENAPEQGINALAWGIDLVDADMVWADFGVRGAGVVVANIDTGVQWDHDALVDTFNCPGDPGNAACWADPSNICGGTACDNNGHGTHTMGTMTASDDPGLTWQAGMAPDSTWIACKGCESSSCSEFALNTCADWILAPDGDPANRPHVVNNSWGGGSCDNWYLGKVQAWRAAGIFPAFSAGNNGPSCNTHGSPGDYAESFSSAATDSGDNVASFSSRGPSCFTSDAKPNVAAPGVAVCSTVPGNGWSCGYSGTSMASPHTAGLVALMWSANPMLAGDIAMTSDIIQETAVCIEDMQCGGDPCPGGNMVYGHGRIDAYAAVAAVAGPLGLPWVWEDPVSGTVPIYDADLIDVTFWCTQTGVLTGALQIRHNDPCIGDIDIPLTLNCTEECVEPIGADFVWDPTEPLVGQMVYFTGTVADGTEPLAYAWDFGDGTMGNGANPTHAYAMTGTYTVLMTVTNDCGEDYATYDVTVVEGCLEPSGADFSWAPMMPFPGQMVYFTGTVAAGSEPLTYAWDFGDGTMGSGANATHVYAMTGTYTVLMTVTNDCGEDYATYDITVIEGCIPPAGVDYTYMPMAPEAGEMVYFTATVAAGTEPFAYAWDFGDGGTGMGMNVTHTFATTGTFTVTLTVTNTCGMDDMAYAIVVGAPPVETYEIYLPIIVRPATP